MTDVRLAGCTPAPMGAYLQALGVLRIVAEQKDSAAAGWWDGEYFVLRSELDSDALVRFLLEEYSPTPVIAPWNGGSGFFPKDNKTGIAAIDADDSPRFGPYRAAIALARDILTAGGITEKPDTRLKELLILTLRDELDEASLSWLDAALVLTQSGVRYPPLLGTGGNDGRLDFTNNQMQWLAALLIQHPPNTESLLRGALFGTPVPGLANAAIGQFAPAMAGGANAGQGFTAGARVNGWQYILMIEGALLFAARVTRRLESARPGTLAYPFSVHASGSGYASASSADETRSRQELWLPLWDQPAGLRELRAIFGEGRVNIGPRAAATGVDFARAVSSLAVDRGIAGFARYGFHVRNGLSYFATPLDRWDVRRNERVDLLRVIDGWLDRLRRAAADRDAPAALRTVHRRIEDALLLLCRDDSPRGLQEVLIALGTADRVLVRSRGFTSRKHLSPVPPLPPDWLIRGDDHSPEFRLAAAVAATGVREFMVPVRPDRPRQWAAGDEARLVWGAGELVENLLAVLRRRQIEAARDETAGRETVAGELRQYARTASLEDIARFIDGNIDESRIEGLIAGLACCDWRRITGALRAPAAVVRPPAIYSLLKIVADRQLGPDVRLPLTPGMITRAAARDAYGATTLAVRRLRSAGCMTILQPLTDEPVRTRRSAAAVLFPIAVGDRDELIRSLCMPRPEPTQEPHHDRVYTRRAPPADRGGSPPGSRHALSADRVSRPRSSGVPTS